MSTTTLTHALLEIEVRQPAYETYPDYVSVCTCGRRGILCMFRENAILDQERHEEDPSA